MSKLWLAIIANIIGSIIAFFQLQGWVVWPDKPWLKSMWWVYLTSLIIAPLFFYSTKMSYEHFGAFWNIWGAVLDLICSLESIFEAIC